VPGRTETLRLERDYAATPSEVYAAWTRVEVLSRWFGCADDKLWTVHEWDVRAGGRIHVSLDFDGHPFVVRGEFLVVEPPRRLQYRWSEDEVVEVTIVPRGSGSRLQLAHTFPAGDEPRAIRTAGWSHSLTELGRFARRPGGAG
jgi:uncharacterized protein YndB with AHSA1/START domain